MHSPDPNLPDRARTIGLVLIVDDVPDNLAVLHDALDAAGYTVLVATDGTSALQRAAQADPDIVLLDAVMPGIDGFEVARRLKAGPETAYTPIVFMTGLTDTEDGLAAFQYPATEISEHDESDAFGPRARRKPQQCPEALRGFATRPSGRRRAFVFRNLRDGVPGRWGGRRRQAHTPTRSAGA